MGQTARMKRVEQSFLIYYILTTFPSLYRLKKKADAFQMIRAKKRGETVTFNNFIISKLKIGFRRFVP